MQLAEELELDRQGIMDPTDLQQTLFDLPRYRTISSTEIGFSNALESSPHNWMHTPFTRGDMGNDITAARDAIFWSYHCYLDLMWYRWQLQHQAFAGAPSHLLPPDLSKAYDHFPTPMTVGETLNPHDLGYTYDLAGVPEDAVPMAANVERLTPANNSSNSFRWPSRPNAAVATQSDATADRAVAILDALVPPAEGSWSVEFYLHPANVTPQFDDPVFRSRYRAGQYVAWRGSHRPPQSGEQDVLVQLSPRRIAASQNSSEEFYLSMYLRLLPSSVEQGVQAETLDSAASATMKFKSLSVKIE